MNAATSEEVSFDFVKPDEVATAYEIEMSGFLPEEAASLDTFRTRQSVAPNLFLGAYIPQRALVGYVNATLAPSLSLTADSMHGHDPSGTSVCVHAVAVADQHRRKGVASKLLREYIRRLEEYPDVGGTRVQRVLLICHENLIPLYTGVGFTLVGKSNVIHGPLEWYEMRRELESPSSEAMPGGVPSDVMAALLNPSRNRPSARLFSSFPSSRDLVSSSGENKYDILCPRAACGSLVLKAGVAKLETRESFELEPVDHHPPEPLTRLPPPPAQIDWWLITPSPMAFENIAFSRPVASSTPRESQQIKLLGCAECELGPFGWSIAGGNEFWLAISRVAYRSS